jgi:succinyl-diaminopimelate desuccinylase
MSRVIDLTRELVRFNTVNPPGDEEAAMRHLGGYFADRGIAVEYQPLAPNRVNLVARLHGRGDGHLVLCGHMDVVHPGTSEWEHDPFAADIVNGTLIGRGATDMKGGVAAMAQSLVELAESGFEPSADLVVAITCGEEVDMAGARLLDASQALEGTHNVVIGEPTGLDIFCAEKGVFWPKITARGRTSHGAMPHLGVNAIVFVSRLIGRLEEYPFPFERSRTLGDPTLSVNVISGGVKTNVVADRCSVEFDMRLVPGQKTDDILAQLNALMDELRAEIPVEVTVDILQDAPALESPPDSRLVLAAVAAVRERCGRQPAVGGVSYATDGALIAPSLGADMIICGPGGVDQLHQPNEYVEVSQLEDAVEVYKAIALTLLGE